MRKLFKLSSLLMLLVFMLTGIQSANAQTPIEFGKTYTAPAFQYFNGAITIASPGTLTVVVVGTEGTLYSPSDTEINYSGNKYLDEGQEFTYELTATGTYNYICPTPWDDSSYTFTFTGEGGSTGGGGDSGDNVLPVPTTGFILSQDMYTYTPTENGILTIVYQEMPYDNCLYSTWDGNHGVDKVALEEGINPNTDYEFRWALKGGNTYYLNSSYPANNVVTTSFVATGGSTDPDPGPGGGDDPDPGPGGDIGAYSAVELGKTYTLADGETLAVYFTPSSNGTLKISQWGTEDPFLFLAPTENPEDYGNMAPNDGYIGSDPCVYTYSVTAGTTYYYYGVHNQAAWLELNKVIFEFEGSGGGGGDNPGQPGEVPEGYAALELNQNYSITGVGSVKLAYTPSTSGTLIVTQTGSYDSHLFNVVPEYSDTYGYDGNTPMQTQGDGGYSGENPYTLKYGVAAGVTYYYVAKTGTYDDISAVTFEFEGANNDNNILLDTPYVVNYQSPIYTFTPEETGILTVSWTNPYPGGEAALGTTFYQGSTQFFLYSDYGLSNAVPMLGHDEIEDVGCQVTFNVVAGNHYYLHLDAIYNWQCVFTMEAGALQAAAIKTIEPVPGTAYDTVNFQYYWNLILAPNEPSLDKVTLTYVPANDPTTENTIELTTQTIDGGVFPPFEFGGDAMRISAVELNNLLSHNEIANETDIVFTLYGLKAAGEYVVDNLMVQGDQYVNIGENGLVTVTFRCGTPIALLTQQWPSPFLNGWERGDKAGMATLTYDQEIYHVGAVTVTQGRQYYGSEGGGDTPPYSVTVPAQNVTWEGNTVNIDFTNINFNMPSGTSEVTITVSGPTGANGLPASYDGIPVLQHYATFSADGTVVLPESIISTIEPRDGVTFSGLSEGEIIEIFLLEDVRETTSTLTGVLSQENGAVLGTFGFVKTVRGVWIYELQENYTFLKDEAYLFTVTAQDAAGEIIGKQVVYWYGSSEGSVTDVPEPTVIVPFKGEAERLENMFMVTWGYNALEDNAGDDPMQATLTFPDGTVKTVKGQITDANGVENGDVPSMPASQNNALMFRNFMTLDQETMQYIQQIGTYKVSIPEGIVLVDGVENPAAELTFVITGEVESDFMDYATLLVPASEFAGSCLEAQITWDMQNISLTDKVEDLVVKVDMNTYTYDELTVFLTDATGTDDPGIGFVKALAEGDDENVANSVIISLPFEVFEMTGDFVFMLPEGMVVNEEGKMNPAQNITVTVLPITDKLPTITPACENYGSATVESLKEITLTWDMPAILNEGAEVRLDFEGMQFNLVEYGLVNVDDETNTVILDLSEAVTEDGTYNLVLGEAAFILGNITNWCVNQEGYYTFIVSEDSGIAKFVDAEDGRYNVYGIDGVRILSTDNAADLNQLEPGRIYIINGKKVIVRK